MTVAGHLACILGIMHNPHSGLSSRQREGHQRFWQQTCHHAGARFCNMLHVPLFSDEIARVLAMLIMLLHWQVEKPKFS